jgi:hypothetical protein
MSHSPNDQSKLEAPSPIAPCLDCRSRVAGEEASAYQTHLPPSGYVVDRSPMRAGRKDYAGTYTSWTPPSAQPEDNHLPHSESPIYELQLELPFDGEIEVELEPQTQQ